MTEPGIQPRIHKTAENCFYVELGAEYRDGYHVTVGWSEDSDVWIARCAGLSTGDAIADGPTPLAALLDLACSLAAVVDAVNSVPASAGIPCS